MNNLSTGCAECAANQCQDCDRAGGTRPDATGVRQPTCCCGRRFRPATADADIDQLDRDQREGDQRRGGSVMVTTVDFTYDPREPSWTISHVGGRPRIVLGPTGADSAYHSQRLVLMLLELCEGIAPGDAAARLDALIIEQRDG